MKSANKLKIAIETIPEEGLHIGEGISPDYFTGIDIQINEAVELSTDIFVSGDNITAKGSLIFSAGLECSRCLKKIDTRINSQFEVEFKKIESQIQKSDIEIEPADMEVDFIKDDFIDLLDLTAQQIVLAMPMKPLCSNNCKGLCSVCGADKNVKDCGCIETSKDPRFAVLAELKKRINR